MVVCLVWFGLVLVGFGWFCFVSADSLVWFGLVWFGLVWFGLVSADNRQQTAVFCFCFSVLFWFVLFQQTTDSRQQTADNRQQTTDSSFLFVWFCRFCFSRQRTADNKQQTRTDRVGSSRSTARSEIICEVTMREQLVAERKGLAVGCHVRHIKQ